MSEYKNPITTLGNRINERMVNVAIDMLLGVLMAVVRPLAGITEVLFRRHMGERYFTSFNVGGGLLLIALSGFPFWDARFAPERIVDRGLQLQHLSQEESLTVIAAQVWMGLFLLCSLLHFVSVRTRYRRGVRWHSFCSGIPRLAGLTPGLEHIICLAGAAALIWYGAYSPGVLLILSTYFSYKSGAVSAARFRNRVLDVVDQQIEAENLSQAVLERLQPAQAEGLMTPLPAYVSDKYRELFVGKKREAARNPVQSEPPALMAVGAGEARMLD